MSVTAQDMALQAALAAHAAGLCVVPPAQDGTKRPDGTWKRYQEERPSEATLRAWYDDGTRTGVGLICGGVSGGLEMLELEGRAIESGLVDEFDRMANEAGLGPLVGRIQDGYCERTPAGGLHLLYRCTTVDGNLKLARAESGDVLIETRGEGGFVIVAPSNGGVHPTGGAWVLTDGGFATIATITPDERLALLNLCRLFDRFAEPKSDNRANNISANVTPPRDGDSRPGDEFGATHTCHDVLLAAGFVEHSRSNRDVHYTRPGKEPRHGSSATVYGDAGTCTLFSSSIGAPAEYLDGHHKLTPWRLHVALNHGGDHSEAARRWRADHPRPRAVAGVLDDYSAESEAPASDPRYLPESFWAARPVLGWIRQAARARMTAPDGVLNAVLGRIAAFTPHTVELPPIVGGAIGLTYYGANVGPAEAGKSAGSGVARELVPKRTDDALDMLPLGSGEGYVEALFEYDAEAKQKEQKWHGAYFYVDEGAILGELSSRSGTTLLPTLRSAFSHQTLGATNASKEKRRQLHGTQYVYGITLGIQPELAGPFLADAPAGTPQRFVYLRADDPTMTVDPIEWPGPLSWLPFDAALLERYAVTVGGWKRHRVEVAASVRQEIRVDRVDAQHNPRPPMEAHRTLVRLKVAALLAILEERMAVQEDDWALAGIVVDVSRAVRQGIEGTLTDVARRTEDARTAAHVRRELTVDSSRSGHALDVMARAMARHAVKHDDPDGCTARCLARATSAKYRQEATVEEAALHAVSKGWLVEVGDRFKLGESRPA